MMGNYHVRFLGGKGAVTPPTYPVCTNHFTGEIQMRKAIMFLLTVILMICFNSAVAEEKKDLEKLRQEQSKIFGAQGLIKPYEVRKNAKSYLSKPLSQQNIVELKKLSKQANIAANLFGMILEEYKDYYRDNYSYDFVQEKIAPYHDRFVELSNELLYYRNQCYFNLGEKLKAKGNVVEAFFYYRDAYRLSSFTDSKGDHKGMRYKAEQKLKELLGISDIPSFVFWK